MKNPLLFCLLIVLANSKPLILDTKPTEIKVEKGTTLYFLTSGNEAELKGITVKAANSNINTNVYAYSVPQPDGSLNPLTITADDTVVITRPEGSTVAVNLYQNILLTENLNVFPVFEKSAIQFKSGANAFFAVDKPAGKILTIQNLKVDPNNNGLLKIDSGVPGDVVSYRFFDSEVYKNVTSYNQLDIPLSSFSMVPVFTGVSYTVSFGQATTTLQPAGLIMTPGYPFTAQLTDNTYKINRIGDERISIHIKPYFYEAISYTTTITADFGFGIQQENSFPSELEGTWAASGTINSVEVKSTGAFAIQYYSNSTAINQPGSTMSPGPGTTPSVITTTGSSSSIPMCLSVFTAIISFLLR